MGLGRRPAKLRTRIALWFLLVLVVWAGLTVGSLEYVFTMAADSFVRDRGTETTRALAVECLPSIHREDFRGLDRLVRAQRVAMPDLRYVFVQDGAGDLLWSTFEQGTPRALHELDHSKAEQLQAPGGTVTVRQVRVDDEDVYDYQLVRAGTAMRVGISSAAARALVWETIPFVVWTGIAALLAVLALALHLSRPIEELTRALGRAVALDHRTGGEGGEGGIEGIWETVRIAEGFGQLMDRIEERTRQLDSARKLAYLGELSTCIAHEVNNPLGVVVLESGWLLRRVQAGGVEDAESRHVERLWNAARYASMVVQKFLQFSRYSRTEEVRPHPVQLGETIVQTLELLGDRVRRAEVSVVTEVPSDMPPVPCDEQGIEQVCMNLMTNAIDASPPGGIITVRLTMSDSAIELAVHDEGPGMPPDVRDRATEPFFTTKPTGSGLGLAISNSIVRAHGGELVFESAPGAGTTVTARLRVSEVRAAAVKATPHEGEP